MRRVPRRLRWRCLIRHSILTAALVALLMFPAPAGASVRPVSASEAICQVFGPYCAQALRVARCESGLRTWAVNGQYLGLFQMGSYARARYGHAGDAYGQARAAYRYFRASGYSWGPWSCRP